MGPGRWLLASIALCALPTRGWCQDDRGPRDEGRVFAQRFGFAARVTDDLDGDGTAEILIVSPFDSTVREGGSGVEIVSRDSGNLWLCSVRRSTVLARRAGVCVGARLGSSVEVLHDSDRGAPRSCMVGEPGFDGGRGRVLVLALPSLEVLREIPGPRAGGGFGVRVIPLGAAEHGEGIVAVFCKPSATPGKELRESIALVRTQTGEVVRTRELAAGEELGRDGLSIGDLDGDGANDLVVGVPNAREARGLRTGRVMILSGRTLETLRSVDGSREGDRLGSALDLVGRGEHGVPSGILVGCPRAASESSSVGDVFLWNFREPRLVSQLPAEEPRDLVSDALPPRPSSRVGSSVAEVGDLNGDGVPDFALGDPWGSIGMEHETGWFAVRSGSDGALLCFTNWREQGTDDVRPMLGLGSAMARAEMLVDGRKRSVLLVSAAEHRSSLGASGVLVFAAEALGPVGRADRDLSRALLWQVTWSDAEGLRAIRPR